MYDDQAFPHFKEQQHLMNGAGSRLVDSSGRHMSYYPIIEGHDEYGQAYLADEKISPAYSSPSNGMAATTVTQTTNTSPIHASAGSSWNHSGSNVILIEDSPEPRRPSAGQHISAPSTVGGHSRQHSNAGLFDVSQLSRRSSLRNASTTTAQPGKVSKRTGGATTRRMAAAKAQEMLPSGIDSRRGSNASIPGASAAPTWSSAQNDAWSQGVQPVQGVSRMQVPPPLFNFGAVPIFPTAGYGQPTAPIAIPQTRHNAATSTAATGSWPGYAQSMTNYWMPAGVSASYNGSRATNAQQSDQLINQLQQQQMQRAAQHDLYMRTAQPHPPQQTLPAAQVKRKRDDPMLQSAGGKTNQRGVDQGQNVLAQRQYHQDIYDNRQQVPGVVKCNKNVEVVLRPEHSENYVRGATFDDSEGHYIVVPNSQFTPRYRIMKLLGQGTFGKVVQAYDCHKRSFVAIKIIRAVQKYRDASMIELRVLRTLQQNDPHNLNKCIHLRDCFDYRNHVCIVTDLLNESVFDFLKGNDFCPFPAAHIQVLARQLFTSVAFLHHDLKLVHTDLKPENILLTHNESVVEPYAGRAGCRTRRVLTVPEIRLIDFGSATFQDEYHSNVVSTRHYRAPEIILGLGWSFPCDIWSVGCILVEFLLGDALFQTHDNLEHLAMMEAVCGRIDGKLVRGCSASAKKLFRSSGRLDYPNRETTRDSRRFVKAMRRLDDLLPPNTATFNDQLRDLLQRVFVYDQGKRITAKQALQHPFFRTPIDVDY